MIRILLVDDQNLVQQGIKALLAQDSNFKVIGTVKDGRSAVEQTDLLNPDIVLLDIEMPDMDGITATKYITHLAPKTKVIILTSYEDKKYVMRALMAGAKGYILKSSLITDLKQAILAVHNGYSQLESRLLAKIFHPDNFKPRKSQSFSSQQSIKIQSKSKISPHSLNIKQSSSVNKKEEKLESPKNQANTDYFKVSSDNNSSLLDSNYHQKKQKKKLNQNKSQKKSISIVNQASLQPIFKSYSLPEKSSKNINNTDKTINIVVKQQVKKIINKIKIFPIDRYKFKIFNFFRSKTSQLKPKILKLTRRYYQLSYIGKIGLVILGLVIFLILHNL